MTKYTTPTRYGYAGFEYEIRYDGDRLLAFPLPGQHPAANKEKHRRAALSLFLKEIDW